MNYGDYFDLDCDPEYNDSLNMKKLLVTGSEGYIGTRLVQSLIKEGFDVTGLDTGFFEEGHLYDQKGETYPIIRRDTRDVVPEDFRGFDAVAHLAELSNDPLGRVDPELTIDVNQRGTKRVVDSARAAGVGRFIYFSSCSVYGASETVSDETTAPNPLTEYARSKVANESYLRTVADDSFSPVIFRNSTVFGASPRMRFDLVVNDLCALAYTQKRIAMASDGTPWRPFVHIEDIAKALVMTFRAPRESIHNVMINIGSNDNNYQIKSIAETIAQEFPGCTTEFGEPGGDKRNYRVNFDKITRVLPGFSCDWNIAKGAKELHEIFDRIGLSKDVYESRFYTRLKQLEYLRSSQKVTQDLRWQ